MVCQSILGTKYILLGMYLYCYYTVICFSIIVNKNTVLIFIFSKIITLTLMLIYFWINNRKIFHIYIIIYYCYLLLSNSKLSQYRLIVEGL